jgi:hypothetical protein
MKTDVSFEKVIDAIERLSDLIIGNISPDLPSGVAPMASTLETTPV